MTYMDYVSLIWMNQEADDPNSDLTGGWCHAVNGKRYKTSEMPTEPIPWRDNTQCIAQAPKGVHG